jgi:hypothetical protein
LLAVPLYSLACIVTFTSYFTLQLTYNNDKHDYKETIDTLYKRGKGTKKEFNRRIALTVKAGVRELAFHIQEKCTNIKEEYENY